MTRERADEIMEKAKAGGTCSYGYIWEEHLHDHMTQEEETVVHARWMTMDGSWWDAFNSFRIGG